VLKCCTGSLLTRLYNITALSAETSQQTFMTVFNQPKLICPIQATTAFCPVGNTFEQLYAQNASSGK
jgi:hypothetical protein